MKTRREMLKRFAQGKGCAGDHCTDCPFYETEKTTNRCLLAGRLTRIGAMAILRMFPEKKKPLLSVGTKIKFSDGRIATIFEAFEPRFKNHYQLDFGDCYIGIDYLIGETWEVVE